VILGLAGALAAAVCYGAASVLQSVGSRRLARAGALDVRLFVRLARSLPYVAGLALDLLGFAASVLALRTLPLFLVQSAVSASIGVTALLAAWRLGAQLRRAERYALLALLVGLLLLAVSARPERAASLAGPARWALLALLSVPVLAALAAVRLRGAAAGAALAAAAGLAFTGVGVAARVLVIPDPLWRVGGDPVLYALAGYGLLGVLLFAGALQRGSVTTAAAITFAVQTVVPALIGLALLGDSARAGFGPVAVAGFVLALGGALALARYAEPVGPSG